MADSWSSTVSSAGGNFGSAVSDLFAAKGGQSTAAGYRLQAQGLRYQSQGDYLAQEGYTKAAGLAQQNVGYAQQSTELQKVAAQRQATLAIGGQQADVAAAGVVGGSAQYLLRASQEQAGLTQHVLETQGKINADAYEQQAQAYTTQAQQEGVAGKVADIAAQSADESAYGAETASNGNIFAGAVQGAVGLAKLGAMLL